MSVSLKSTSPLPVRACEIAAISAISHALTGNGEVLFKDTDKKVYVSRGYYKALKEKIYDMKGLK